MTDGAAPLSPREILDGMQSAIASRDETLLRALLADLHPADVAELIANLDPDERAFAFSILRRRAPAVLSEVDGEIQSELLDILGDAEVGRIVKELPSDEAVDILGVLPEERALNILRHVGDPEARGIRKLLKFAEDTAGGIMAAEFVAVHDDATAADAIEELRRRADELEEHQRVYVIDHDGKLVGTLSLGRLLLARPTTPISQIMKGDVISVPTDMDQEEVAAIVRKYDLVAVPVVDAEGKMVGSISIDDVVDVMQEEASEDVARMAGTTDEEIGEESVLRVSTIRLPWLIAGLIGECVAALLLSRYERSLEAVLALAFFIPVITAMGGNVGMQSSAVVVRAIALGEWNLVDLRRQLFRAVAVASINGLVCGGLLALVAGLWQGDPRLGAVVGISLFAGMIVAGITGTFYPLVLRRLRVDPAIASGPFVTVSNDVLNLLIYFTVASVALSWLMAGR